MSDQYGLRNVGVIGLGQLGTPLALNLLEAGHRLTVYDLNPTAAKRLSQFGARQVDSAAHVAADSEIVLTVLPSPAAVETAVAGPDGVLQCAEPGTLWIDCSTNDLHMIRSLARRAAEQDVDTLEAPVTGGIPRAHSGEITVLVGGSESLFESHRPLFQVIGGEILYLGELGSASIAKIVTNLLAFVHLWALGEGLMLGKRAGLDVGPLFQAILQSCGSSFVAETEGPEILNGSYDYGFTLALAAKDMRLAHELAREHGVPLEVGGLVEQILTRARSRYGDDAWSTQLVKLLEDDLGTDLRAPGYGGDRGS